MLDRQENVTVLEVGALGEGNPKDPASWGIRVQRAGGEVVTLSATVEQCRAAAAHLYRPVRLTLSLSAIPDEATR